MGWDEDLEIEAPLAPELQAVLDQLGSTRSVEKKVHENVPKTDGSIGDVFEWLKINKGMNDLQPCKDLRLLKECIPNVFRWILSLFLRSGKLN